MLLPLQGADNVGDTTQGAALGYELLPLRGVWVRKADFFVFLRRLKPCESVLAPFWVGAEKRIFLFFYAGQEAVRSQRLRPYGLKPAR